MNNHKITVLFLVLVLIFGHTLAFGHILADADENYSNCNNVIVGAGWSGAYFTWRTTVNTKLYDPKETCIFEATDRIGGRAYSHLVPGFGQEDVVADLGAYRFDMFNNPLISHVILKVLKLPTRPFYDVTSNAVSTMLNIKDVYGNNAGYSTAPEGLIKLAVEQGVRIFYGHRLSGIFRDEPSPSKKITLNFENGLSLTADKAFLNLPAPSVRNLEKTSVLFEDNKVAQLLHAPQEHPAIKQFLLYDNAVWMEYPELRSGNFVDHSSHPWLEGRLHDFSGKCPIGSHSDECWGAVLTHYTLNIPEAYEYYYPFQENKSEPYTYIPRGGKHDDLILKTDEKFRKVLVQKAKEHNINFDVDRLPLPIGTIVVVWSSHENSPESSVRPSFSCLIQLDKDGNVKSLENGRSEILDPDHGARNIMMHPVPDLDIYLANTDYSGGCGWADPTLILTERILSQSMKAPIPDFVNETCVDCETGSNDGSNCSPCVSKTWWDDEITSFTIREIKHVCVGDIQKENCQPGDMIYPYPYMENCKRKYSSQHLNLSWKWKDSKTIIIKFEIRATSWAGLGIGESMSSADMVVAWVKRDGSVEAGQYHSNQHVKPDQINSVPCCKDCPDSSSTCSCESNCTYINVISTSYQDGIISVEFERPATSPRKWGLDIQIAGQTNFIYARDGTPESTPSYGFINHHDFAIADNVGFNCRRPLDVSWNEIQPLFRKKDREGMKWRFDLWDCAAVASNAKEIIVQIQAKTIFRLTQGMPIDVTWSTQDLEKLIAWNAQEDKCPKEICKNESITFYPDVKNLFVEEDRTAMLYGFDLWKYEDVWKHNNAILTRLEDGSMPCEMSGRKWTSEMLDTYKQWILCGMKEGVDQENVLRDRDFFYLALNEYTHKGDPKYYQQARRQMAYYNKLASNQGHNETCLGPFNPLFQYFNYTEEALIRRLDEIYTDKVKRSDAYVVENDTSYNTKEKAVNGILQRAPFSLVDGVEIAQCCPTGPIDEVHALLWKILNEEVGGGDISLNHCILYDTLLKELGIFLPPVHSYAFSNDVRLIDSAFTVPAYKAGLAVLNNELFPEMIGTALQIEWCVVDLEIIVKRCDAFGIPKQFFTMHIGIDNAVAGHGYSAKRAVILHLNKVRSERGEEAVQEEFRRVWTGFLAMAAMGNLGNDLAKMNANLGNDRENWETLIIQMVGQKAPYASQNHREKRLGKLTINELFSKPREFLDLIRDSAWIVPGSPSDSTFFTYLTTFKGPMFEVFTEKEIEIWKNWIVSLAEYQERQKGNLDLYNAMRSVISRLSLLGFADDHHTRIKLLGLSPITGQEIEQDVMTWLEISQEDPDIMLNTLLYAKNGLITPGNSKTSSFLGTLTRHNAMSVAWGYTIAHASGLNYPKHTEDNWSALEIIIAWIDAGCPMTPMPGHTFKLFPESQIIKKAKIIPEWVHGRGETH